MKKRHYFVPFSSLNAQKRPSLIRKRKKENKKNKKKSFFLFFSLFFSPTFPFSCQKMEETEKVWCFLCETHLSSLFTLKRHLETLHADQMMVDALFRCEIPGCSQPCLVMSPNQFLSHYCSHFRWRAEDAALVILGSQKKSQIFLNRTWKIF